MINEGLSDSIHCQSTSHQGTPQTEHPSTVRAGGARTSSYPGFPKPRPGTQGLALCFAQNEPHWMLTTQFLWTVLTDGRKSPSSPSTAFPEMADNDSQSGQPTSLFCFHFGKTLVWAQIWEKKLINYQRILGSNALSVKQIARQRGQLASRNQGYSNYQRVYLSRCIPWYVHIKN